MDIGNIALQNIPKSYSIYFILFICLLVANKASRSSEIAKVALRGGKSVRYLGKSSIAAFSVVLCNYCADDLAPGL